MSNTIFGCKKVEIAPVSNYELGSADFSELCKTYRDSVEISEDDPDIQLEYSDMADTPIADFVEAGTTNISFQAFEFDNGTLKRLFPNGEVDDGKFNLRKNTGFNAAIRFVTDSGHVLTWPRVAVFPKKNIDLKKKSLGLIDVMVRPLSSVTIKKAVWDGVYGFSYDVDKPATEVQRIGDMSMHRAENLPAQKTLKGCLVNDDGTINYYLDPDDWSKKKNGGPSKLNGTDGNVEVEFGGFFVRYQTEGDINQVLFALHEFPGSTYVAKQYFAAYEATVDRDNDKLASVMSDAPKYRGGNNNNSLDEENEFKTNLGKPATNISLNGLRDYAANVGSSAAAHWYNQHKLIAWLITCEYADRDHQKSHTDELTAEGFRKGALGQGPTTAVKQDWVDYNNQYPIFKCGSTNEFGNHTGVNTITVPDFKDGGDKDLEVEVFRYRGIENFYGHIYEWSDGVMKDHEKVYVADFLDQDVLEKEGRYIGDGPTSKGYMTKAIFGDHGDIVAKENSGGSSSTYFADYAYMYDKASRGFRFGRNLYGGRNAGSFLANTPIAPSTSHAASGSRLCFLPNHVTES